MMVWLKRLFATFAIGFLVYFGWQSRDLLAETIISANLFYLAAATAIWLLMHLISPLFTVLVFRGSGFDIAFNAAARIHLSNLPARYIPGGIWHTVGRIVAFREMGIDARRISLFVICENGLAVAVAFILGGGVLYMFRGLENWGGLAALCAVGGAISLLLLPVITQYLLFRGMQGLGGRYYLMSVAIAALSWCIASTAFVVFISAFTALELDISFLETAAVYLFSWGVGFVAVFAPQGIGVFEVMAGELLRGSLALGGIAVLLAGFRAVIFIADLFAWLLGRLLLSSSASEPGL